MFIAGIWFTARKSLLLMICIHALVLANRYRAKAIFDRLPHEHLGYHSVQPNRINDCVDQQHRNSNC